MHKVDYNVHEYHFSWFHFSNTSNSMTMAYIMGTNTKNYTSPKRQPTPTINNTSHNSLSLSQIEYILSNWLNCQCHVSNLFCKSDQLLTTTKHRSEEHTSEL